MKIAKTNYLWLALSFILAFASCEYNLPDEPDKPKEPPYKYPSLDVVTTFTGSICQVWRAESFGFEITVESNEYTNKVLDSIQITVSGTSNSFDSIIYVNDTFYKFYYFYKVPKEVKDNDQITIKFMVTDKAGEFKDKSFILKVVADAFYWENIELGAQGSSLPYFYSTAHGKTYTLFNDEAKKYQHNIDFLYVYNEKPDGLKTLATLISPHDTEILGYTDTSKQINYLIHEWNIRNKTTFRKLDSNSFTKQEFKEFTSAQLAQKYNYSSSTSMNYAGHLQATPPGKIAFKTADGRYGIIWVKELKQNNGLYRNGSIVFDVRVEKP